VTSGSVTPATIESAELTLGSSRARSHGRLKRLVVVLGPPLVTLGVFVGIVYLISYVVLSPGRRWLLPPPHDVITNGLLNGRHLHDQLSALWDTAQVSLTGLAIAFAIGATIALAMSQAKWVERSLYPYAVIVQVTPILAIVPLIATWFGYDFTARVVVCVLISVFPIITNTLHGLLTVDTQLHDLFKLHGAGRIKRVLKLQIPHAIPDVFVGLRVSAGLSVIGAIVGEFFFRQGTPGLGRLLDLYRAYLQTDLLMSALLFCCALGIGSFLAVGLIGRQLTKDWYEEDNR
jgi:NitT/TauT family transport system permease protein